MTSKHDCSQELKNVHLKVTSARLAVLSLLEKSKKPIDIESITQQVNKTIKVDPATVFRILNAFTERGITKHVQLHEGKFRYELANIPDHHHLICGRCGDIEDISDCGISQLEEEIRTKKKFFVTHHSLEFFGLCSNCQK